MRYSPLTFGVIVVLIHITGWTLPEAPAQNAKPGLDAVAQVGRWRATGSMHEHREYAGGVRLKNGKVLAVSGHPLEGKSIASSELYDPQTERWSDTGALRQPHNNGNEATLLHDGRVLLAGGHNNSHVLRGIEVYDPTIGTWADAGSLRVPRDPMATLLADGRVLLSGGIDWYIGAGRPYAETEIFDPLTGQCTETDSLATPRYEHRAERLDNGRVLVVGGYGPGEEILASAEVYDPALGRWHKSAPLPQPRAWFGHVKLRDGRVLVTGGYTGGRKRRTYLKTTMLYDPITNAWNETASMETRRAGFSITLLSDGQVLVAGGVADSGAELKSSELYDPGTETWRPAAPMNVARRNPRAALLSDGSVLVIGGSNVYGGKTLTSCERFSF